MSSEEEREVGSAQGPTRPQLGSEEPAKDSAGADPRAASSTARGAEVDDWLANLVPLADRDDDLIRQVTEAWVLTIRSNRRLTRRR